MDMFLSYPLTNTSHIIYVTSIFLISEITHKSMGGKHAGRRTLLVQSNAKMVTGLLHLESVGKSAGKQLLPAGASPHAFPHCQ